ncbi:MAG: haloacid dehalogenase-like hydrolase [Candidatus Aminicenantes bacterium]|nr:haloacid dehalogenase-like hydrolase [Candidatus Aminicenantes bacterium]
MRLKRGNWSAANIKALNDMLAGVQAGEIAVFDWDNTCIFGDIGEALLRRMTFGLKFRIDARTMAATVPDRIGGVGRIRIQGRAIPLKIMKEAVFSAYERLQERPGPSAGRDCFEEDYRVFTSGLLAMNRSLEETPGIGCEFAYPWVNVLLQGLTPAEVDEIAAVVIARELKEPLRRRSACDPQRRWRYGWTSGIRLYPEMLDLASRWRERGGTVVVSTASNRRLVEGMIAQTGFPCGEVIGMELALARGRFAGRLKRGLLPNLGQGKVANFRSRFQLGPAFVAGDSDNDYEMLTAFPATRLRLVVDRSSAARIAALARRARTGERGFLSQAIDPRQGQFMPAGRGKRG